MRILELESYFKDEITLGKVLESISEDIEKIDYYANLLKSGVTDNAEEVKKAITELTGIYMSLKPILAVASSEKENKEVRAYTVLRTEIENAGGKFVSAQADKQASLQVANYRRIRNIIEGYVNATEKAISTLQSVLKYLSEEQKMSK